MTKKFFMTMLILTTFNFYSPLLAQQKTTVVKPQKKIVINPTTSVVPTKPESKVEVKVEQPQVQVSNTEEARPEEVTSKNEEHIVNVTNTATSPEIEKARNSLDIYRVGGRDQRVRFFVSKNDYILDSAQYKKVSTDPIKRSNGYVHCVFGADCSNSKDVGLGEFSDGGELTGYIVSPQLMICAVDQLKIVEAVGNKNPKIFSKWKIDEINIFLKPVKAIDLKKDYKLNIGPVANIPRDPSLNIQIPLVAKDNFCGLMQAEVFEKALKEASDKE